MNIFNNIKNSILYPSLRNKLVFIIASAAILMTATAIIFTMIKIEGQMEEHAIETAETVTNLIADYCSIDLFFNSPENSQSTLERLGQTKSVQAAFLFDKNGKLFAKYGNINLDFNKIKEHQFQSDPVGEESVHIIRPVYFKQQKVGTVFVQISLEKYKKQLKEFWYFSGFLFFTLIIISIFIALRVQGLVSSPILQLSDIARKITDEGMDQVKIPPVKTRDEIGTLYSSFAKMIDTIHKVTEDLRLKNIELEESKLYFQTLFHSSPESICLVASDGTLKDWNSTFESTFMANGVQPPRFDQMFVDSEKIVVTITELFSNEIRSPYQFEAEITMIDGTTRYYLIKMSKVKLKNEQYILTLMSDITDEKKAQEQIISLKNYLTNIIESMPSALMVIGQDFTIKFLNSASLQLFSVEEENVLDSTLWDIFPVLKPYKPYIEKVVKSQNAESIISQPFLLDDERYYLDLHFFPVIGDPESKVVIRVDDVTDMVLKEEQLRQAQKMETIGTLAGGFAHDFNNVLGVILGQVSVLQFILDKEKQIPYDKLKSACTEIESSASRAAEMVKQLLALSKKQEMKFSYIDLNQVLMGVKRICESSFDKRIKLDFRISKEKKVIFGDEAHLEQVLLNLCINSSHAMTIMRKDEKEWGGTLIVDVKKIFADHEFLNSHPEAIYGDYWMIEVVDTGVGIDSKIISKIFDPFFTTKAKGEGTGLGLAMVYYIVKQHNGFIDVYSEPGKGTVFRIYLPFVEKDSFDKSTKEEDITNYFGEGKILVIDDEISMRNSATAILTIAGYEVETVPSGKEAILKFFPGKYDLIILDLLMPEMTGKEVFHHLKQMDPNVKVILATGFARDKRVEEMLKEGVLDYVPKPYTMQILLKKVYQVLKGIQDKNAFN